MFTNISLTRIIKFAKLLLREPYCLPGKLHIDASFSVLALVYDNLIIIFHIYKTDTINRYSRQMYRAMESYFGKSFIDRFGIEQVVTDNIHQLVKRFKSLRIGQLILLTLCQ